MVQQQGQAEDAALGDAGNGVDIIQPESLYRAAESGNGAGLRTNAGLQFNKTFPVI